MLLFIALFLFWTILNGKCNVEIAVFGVVLAGVITWFAHSHLGYKDRKSHSLKYYGLFAKYILVLVIEIIKANICVMKIAFREKMNFQPAVVYFEPALHDEFARVMLANSITLTPGTITVLLEEGRYCVHCLDKSLAEAIDTSVFVQILRQMEEA